MDAFRRLSFHERNYTEHPFCFIIHTHITYTRIILSYMSALLYVIYTSYFQISVIFHAKRLYYVIYTSYFQASIILHATFLGLHISHAYYGISKYNAVALVRKSYRIFHTEWFPPNRLTQEP